VHPKTRGITPAPYSLPATADLLDTPDELSVPRGRHAPPLEVRLRVQRRRLLEAAAAVFSRVGYAEAGVQAISREAGMSKATFYEHFANKEECILAVFETAANDVFHLLAQSPGHVTDTYEEHVRARVHAFLEILARHPTAAQTILVEIIGAGPSAAKRRDAVIQAFAEVMHADNARVAPEYGAPTYASLDDAFAVAGGIAELASRQIRTGNPADIRELEDVCVRLILGVLSQSGR
jgi:AcrR family transcriptional regulator